MFVEPALLLFERMILELHENKQFIFKIVGKGKDISLRRQFFGSN